MLWVHIEDISPGCCGPLHVLGLVQQGGYPESRVDVVLVILGCILKIVHGVFEATEVEVQESALIPRIGMCGINL